MIKRESFLCDNIVERVFPKISFWNTYLIAHIKEKHTHTHAYSSGHCRRGGKFGFRYMKKPKPKEKHSEKITGTQRDGPRTVAES